MEPLSREELICVEGCLGVVADGYPDAAIRAGAAELLEQVRAEGGVEGLTAGRLGKVCLALGLGRDAVRGTPGLDAAERVRLLEDINCLVAKLRGRLPAEHRAVLDDEA
jgi:hypothetical protein